MVYYQFKKNSMKAVIFAGGAGTRLWPLSRKKSPKQFEKIVGEKSTLQHAVERLLPEFSPQDIFISTNERYFESVIEQLAFIPRENFICEPMKKDVGPAIALVMGILEKRFGRVGSFRSPDVVQENVFGQESGEAALIGWHSKI